MFLEGKYYKILKDDLFFDKNINYSQTNNLDSKVSGILNTAVSINESNLNVDNINNDNTLSNESSIDKNKNDNLDNNNDSLCESISNNNNSDDIEHKTKIPENIELLTIENLFYEILKKSNKKEEDYPDAKLLKQFSVQMMSKYKFERKDCWDSNENILQRRAKINRQMYEWALENIRL